MTGEAAFGVAAACFAIATTVGIDLREGRTVPTAAALAPTAAALGVAAEVPWPLIVGMPMLLAIGAQAVTRSVAWQTVSHLGLYALGATCMILLNVDLPRDRSVALGLAVGATLTYSFGEATRQRAWRSINLRGRSDLKTWLLLQCVLVSASGLTIMVVDRLGAIPVIAMLLVLILTKREFEDLARSRVALEQTVRSLERLSELAARD